MTPDKVAFYHRFYFVVCYVTLHEQSGVGCNIGGVFINVLADADDTVLIAPSWRPMQHLLTVLDKHVVKIDVRCNESETVCMVFQPKRRSQIVSLYFPQLKLGILGNFYVKSLSISRLHSILQHEVRNMFMRTNMLVQWFAKRCRNFIWCKSSDIGFVLYVSMFLLSFLVVLYTAISVLFSYCILFYIYVLWAMLPELNVYINVIVWWRRRDGGTERSGILLFSSKTFLSVKYTVFCVLCRDACVNITNCWRTTDCHSSWLKK